MKSPDSPHDNQEDRMDIHLNFINMSNDTNNSSVVIFGQNVATTFGDLPVAWKVIENCGQGDNHPFRYPMGWQISASDSWGNYTPRLGAYPGDGFEMNLTMSGDTLSLSRPSTRPTSIELRNALPQGAINGQIYKDGRLYAAKTGIAPGQKAEFEFKPTLWIGGVSQVTQGEVMNSAIVSRVNTELSLLGIAGADIVMSGGGPGPNAPAFQFTLQNIVMV
jgi:hypothetical protein